MNNYQIQAMQAKKRFLTYDQQELIPHTEKALHNAFDKDGNRKTESHDEIL